MRPFCLIFRDVLSSHFAIVLIILSWPSSHHLGFIAFEQSLRTADALTLAQRVLKQLGVGMHRCTELGLQALRAALMVMCG